MTEIANLLSLQHATLTSLRTIISAEKEALIAQDADQLLKLAQQKQQCLTSLQEQDKTLATHPDKQMLVDEQVLAQRVTDAKALLDECKQLNSENAQLIELSMASLNRFSQALHASRNSSSMTYTDKGKTSTISTLGSNFKA
ncbi:flagellar protein FlgN [Shewanella maritima]|uniref:Flagellar protein FlgN n=1 Tax=Shewanella maritima TaxID=2520507 RepID=A0A411PE16_9GAMM|nr:flagellar protein FlgN [Shewanella maritima]QBF81771.1 flagellar protein FlgN [Shewanella maritima]